MKRREADKLDRLLSERLKKALGDDGRADWRDVSERAGMGRTLWHWSRRRVLLVAGVLVLAVGAAGASTGIIPWLDEKPKLTPSPKYPYPICGAKDIGAKLSLKRAGKNSGALRGMIILVNKGLGDCALEGQPTVSLVGRDASEAKLRVELFPEGANFLPAGVKKGYSVFSPDPKGATHTLLGRTFAPAEQASRVDFWWQNWCGPDSGSDARLTLRLEMANGSIIDLPVRQLPACNNSAEPSVLRFDRATAASIPRGAALPLRAQIVTDGTGDPLILKPGEVFEYKVALTNMSDRTFRFGDCPLYSEVASVNGKLPFSGDNFVLNCHSVGAMDPGETATFEMKLRVKSEFYGQKIWNGAEGVLEWFTGVETKSPTVARAAFVVETEPSDYSPSDVYGAFAPGTEEATFPRRVELDLTASLYSPNGPVVPGSRRILVRGSSWPGGAIYAWKTESGNVCYLMVGHRSDCDKGEAQTDPIAWTSNQRDGRNAGTPLYVAGLARDGVQKVEAIAGDERFTARLENNAFYAEVPSDRLITAIVATMADGSQKKVSTGY